VFHKQTIIVPQHLVAMRDFLTRVRKAQFTLRPSKCSVGFYRVPFLGHCVGNNVLEPKLEMVNKILQAPRPTVTIVLRSDRLLQTIHLSASH